jgi:hypothetical protein
MSNLTVETLTYDREESLMRLLFQGDAIWVRNRWLPFQIGLRALAVATAKVKISSRKTASLR